MIFDVTLQRFLIFFVGSLPFIIKIKTALLNLDFNLYQIDTHGQVSKINIIVMQSNLTKKNLNAETKVESPLRIYRIIVVIFAKTILSSFFLSALLK